MMSLSIGNPSGSAVDKFMNSLRMDAPLNVPPRPPADMMGGFYILLPIDHFQVQEDLLGGPFFAYFSDISCLKSLAKSAT